MDIFICYNALAHANLLHDHPAGALFDCKPSIFLYDGLKVGIILDDKLNFFFKEVALSLQVFCYRAPKHHHIFVSILNG
jgi:hypothetical protein